MVVEFYHYYHQVLSMISNHESLDDEYHKISVNSNYEIDPSVSELS